MAADIRAALIVVLAVAMFAAGAWFGSNLGGGCKCDTITHDHRNDHHHGTPNPRGVSPIGATGN